MAVEREQVHTSTDGQASGLGALSEALKFRCVGPHRGGRVVAVAGHPTDRMTFYFGAVAGGVWKTTDGGTYWENISDGFFSTAAVGAIAVSESDPNVIYVGTGETTIRGNVSHGDGVYKSTDGGQTWTNVGLKDTRHIGKIRIHPTNPDVVYVAALGHAWGPNRERGVYRSKDGGATWEQVLFKSERAGAADLAMDPTNPRILYASIWEAQRSPYSLSSGGPDSGLYKSTDGGDTWTEITRNEGLPKGTIGKIGVAVAPSLPTRVYALVEADDGALFRSDDGGNTWQRVSEQGDLRRRAWYYMHVFVDPQDPNTVWVLNIQCWRSIDGGQTFTSWPVPHGDNHDLWMDPNDPDRRIQGDDGGAYVSFNGGNTWSTLYNQPTAQFYHVTTDDRFPYRLYGSQQDNSAITVPSASMSSAVGETEWFVPGGGESGYIAIKPNDPDVIYGGAIGSGPFNGLLYRYDHRTKEWQNVTVWPYDQGMGEGAASLKYRFQWTFPVSFSPHNPDVLYVAGNHLFRSTDGGMSWEVISPDLSRNDPSTLQPSGGPITKDNTGAEVYGTIFAFVESPQTPGMFWAGTDDGLVHLSRDGGATWEEITPPDLKTSEGEWALISIIEPSPHDANTAYLAATRYKLDDTRPYLFKTSDAGKTWTKITTGIPDTEFTRVIREDPGCKGLLFAGTETGIWVSYDDGGNWERLEGSLPVVPVHDFIIKGNNLVVATHGRSFWILDDLGPVRQMAKDRSLEGPRLFAPSQAVRVARREWFWGEEPNPYVVHYADAGPLNVGYRLATKPDGSLTRKYLDGGENSPNGVVVSYYLPEVPEGDISLTFLDAEGNEIRTFSSKKEKKVEEPTVTEAIMTAGGEGQEDEPTAEQAGTDAEEKEDKEPKIPKQRGGNRFVWDMTYPGPTKIEGEKMDFFSPPGPKALPGTYSVRLTVGDTQQTQQFEIVLNPTLSTTREDLQDQFNLHSDIVKTLSRMNEGIQQARDLQGQVDGWAKRVKDRANGKEIADRAQAASKRLKGIQEKLIDDKADDPRNPKPVALNVRLATLIFAIIMSNTRPTQQVHEVYEVLEGEINGVLADLQSAIDTEVAALNDAIRSADLPAVLATAPATPQAAAAE